MASAGRRPGRPDTRGQVVDAAREHFGDVGYARASVRAIAARANVDPSLVYHYFPGGKAALFAEVMQFRRDPREIAEESLRQTDRPKGAAVVRGFLELWEGDDGGAAFRSLAEAMCASPTVAEGVKEFIRERVWSQGAPGDELRRVLVASQLMGLAWARYVLRMEPVATGSLDTIAEAVGPTLDRYMLGPLPGVD